MKEYKESYLGFVLWLLFCISSTVLVAIFTKNSSTHISITALNTTKNLNLILLLH